MAAFDVGAHHTGEASGATFSSSAARCGVCGPEELALRVAGRVVYAGGAWFTHEAKFESVQAALTSVEGLTQQRQAAPKGWRNAVLVAESAPALSVLLGSLCGDNETDGIHQEQGSGGGGAMMGAQGGRFICVYNLVGSFGVFCRPSFFGCAGTIVVGRSEVDGEPGVCVNPSSFLRI